ncbi:MAG: hypothetical protein ABR590_05650 [Spirochaetia bacterium]
MLSKDHDSVPQNSNSVPQNSSSGSEASPQLETFLQSESIPDFSEAAERVWHRLELRGFEPLRPKGRVFSSERVLAVFSGRGQGIAAVAVVAVVLGATLMIMHGTSGFSRVMYTGTAVDQEEVHAAAALSVDDILRLLADGREVPPVTIQIPHSGPFEMRGGPAIRAGTESISVPERSMGSGTNQVFN